MVVKFKFDGLKESPFKIAQKLDESQYWDRDKIESYQLEKLNNLIQDSVDNVNYYRNGRYKNFLKINSLENFDNEFPVLVKEEFVDFSKDFKNERKIKKFVHFTSGSTGLVRRIEVSDSAVSYRIANNIRFYNWWDIDLYDKNVLIWKKPIRKTNFRSLIKKLETIFLGRLLLNVFELNENSCYDFVRSIERFKPVYIRGYKSGVYELARLMEKNGLTFERFCLEMV